MRHDQPTYKMKNLNGNKVKDIHVKLVTVFMSGTLFILLFSLY